MYENMQVTKFKKYKSWNPKVRFCIVKLRFSKKATKFETIFHLI